MLVLSESVRSQGDRKFTTAHLLTEITKIRGHMKVNVINTIIRLNRTNEVFVGKQSVRFGTVFLTETCIGGQGRVLSSFMITQE